MISPETGLEEDVAENSGKFLTTSSSSFCICISRVLRARAASIADFALPTPVEVKLIKESLKKTMLELQLNSYNSEANISSQNSLPQITDASKVNLLNINKYYSSLNN